MPVLLNQSDYASGYTREKQIAEVVAEQWNTQAKTYNLFQKPKDAGGVSSTGWRIAPVHLEGSWGGEAVAEGGDLPVEGAHRTGAFTGSYKRFMWPVYITGSALEALDGVNDHSFGNVEKDAYKAATQSFVKLFNILTFGSGDGNLATISTGAASTTQTTATNDLAHFLRDGMFVQIYDSTKTTQRTSGPTEITAVAAANTSFTLASSVSTTTNDVVVIGGGVSVGVFNGLQYHIANSGTFQGLSRSTYPVLNSTVEDWSSATSFSPGLARRMFLRVDARGVDNKNRMVIIIPHEQAELYADRGYELKRFGASDQTLDLGFRKFEIEGLPLIVDVDCPKAKAFFVDLNAFMWILNRKISIYDLNPYLTDSNPATGRPRDRVLKHLVFSGELVCKEPRALGLATSLLTTSSGNYRTFTS